jgi:20S proteasome alpha/beta subunit
MTVVVAFHCSDGVVIAADSMLTTSMGGIGVGHHHGLKLSVLDGPQLFAFAGDQGQAERFRVMVNGSHASIGPCGVPLDYAIALSSSIIQQFQTTGIAIQSIAANAIVAFEKGGAHHCCVFAGALQPRFLDSYHFYTALGSGMLSADPFLRFLVDVFCPGNAQPSVREGLFLATWAVQHVIDTNPGGVAGPIRVATFERSNGGAFVARSLPDGEIAEHQQAVESAAEALRSWRDQLQSGEAASDAPAPPELME